MLWKPWEGRMAPFKIFGNLYFIGTRPASTHLIDTGDGLLILDSGYQESLYLVLENMRQLGFNPQDIRWIVHSHGHIDHSGATTALLNLVPNIKTYIGAEDLDMVTGAKPTVWAKELNMEFNPFTPDVLINDGDRLTCQHGAHLAPIGGGGAAKAVFFEVLREQGANFAVVIDD